MGLIRKTLAVGTLGTVKGSSKKQRTAKATLQEVQRQNSILDGSAEAAAKAKATRNAHRGLAKAQRKALKSPTPENLQRLRIAYAVAGRTLAHDKTGLEGLTR